MRILYITDSLGAPRSYPNLIRFNDTWPFITCKELNHLVFCEKVEPVYFLTGGLDTKKIRKNIENQYKLYEPNLIILQIGIVDCAPRVLTQVQLAIISRLGFLGRAAHKRIDKNYSKLSQLRNIAYTNIDEFEENLNCLKTSFNGTDIVAVAIANVKKIVGQSLIK